MVSTSLIECEELNSRCQAVLNELPISESHAAAFLADYPLLKLFTLLQSGLVQESGIATVSEALSKVLSSGCGYPTLLHADHALIGAAFHAVYPELRRLAVEQFSRLLATRQEENSISPSGEPLAPGDGTGCTATQHFVVQQLLETLKDPDTGVAAAAVQSLTSWAAGSLGAAKVLSNACTDNELGASVAELVSHRDSTVRLRAAGLLLQVIGSTEENLGTGPLIPLMNELQNQDDPLSCLAALGLLREVVEVSPFEASATQSGVISSSSRAPQPHCLSQTCILELLHQVFPLLMSMMRDPLLCSGSLRSAVALIRLPLVSPEGCPAAAAPARAAALQHTSDLLKVVKAMLSDSGDSPMECEVDVLDATGQLVQSHEAASIFMQDRELVESIIGKALGRSSHPQVRLAALHATASAGGLERASQLHNRVEALLPSSAEDNLRLAMYSTLTTGARSLAGSPAEALWLLLQQPFPQVRVAVYRFMAALCLRTWFAADVARCSPLLQHLLHRSAPADSLPDIPTDASSKLQHWHFACLTSLHATTQDSLLLSQDDAEYILTNSLREISSELQNLVRAGPSGELGANGGEPQVEVAQR